MKKIIVSVLTVMLAVGVAYGTALTANRDTPSAVGDRISIGVFTNVHIYAGAIVAVNSSGYSVPAANASGYTVLGRAEEEVDNTGGATDAEQISIAVGTFRWVNNGISDANIGDIAYVVDDQTVSLTNGSYSTIAGVIRWVDSTGVWVDTRQSKWVEMTTSTTFVASGNISAGGALAITGNSALGAGVSVAGGQTNAGLFMVKGATTVSNTTILGTAAINGIATFGATPVLKTMITTGTNTMLEGTCPGPLVTNTPIWFAITSTNGTTYYVPAVASP